MTNGTEYTFKVRAVNAKGAGAESEKQATPVAADTPCECEGDCEDPDCGCGCNVTIDCDGDCEDDCTCEEDCDCAACEIPPVCECTGKDDCDCGEDCDCEACEDGGDPITSKAALETAIVNANTAKAGVVIHTNAANVDVGTKWVTSDEMDALLEAIAAAEAALANSTTQTQIGNAAAALNTAIGVFNEAKKDGENPVTTPCECDGNEDDCDCGEDCDCDECEPSDPCADRHDFSGSWYKDITHHWKVCERNGTTIGLKAVHTPNIASATCTTAKACTECDFVITAALGHAKASEPYSTTSPTCTEDGTKTYRCVRFAECGYTYAPEKGEDKLGHDFSVFVSTTATCTTAGQDTYKCSRCTETEERDRAALGHLFENYVSNNDATCEEDGTETATCEREGCYETDTVPDTGTAIGHDHQFTSTVAPTCTTRGYDLYTCSHNSAHTEQRNLVSALGHDHTESLVCLRLNCNHKYNIGNTGPGGGRIYYVADGQSGRPLGFTVQMAYPANNYTAHYLEAAPENAHTLVVQWGDYGTAVVGITTFTSTSNVQAGLIGNGRIDTQIIAAHMSGKSITGTAAQRCLAYRGPNNLTDWFLPSLQELYLYYYSGLISEVGWFWSSSQYNNNAVWGVGFNYGDRGYGLKDSISYVRAVRAF